MVAATGSLGAFVPGFARGTKPEAGVVHRMDFCQQLAGRDLLVAGGGHARVRRYERAAGRLCHRASGRRAGGRAPPQHALRNGRRARHPRAERLQQQLRHPAGPGILARRVRTQPGVVGIEVNISCPNVENRGQVFACHPDTARAAIEAARRNIGGDIPLIAKLSPDVTDIVQIAKTVSDAGADGVALINTLLGMVIDTRTMRPKLAQKTGGLSGPAIRPVAVRAVYQVHSALPHLPIVGMGGITSGRDAFEFILAGASAVSIGTATFGDPSAAPRIKSELQSLLQESGFSSLKSAIGYAHRKGE